MKRIYIPVLLVAFALSAKAQKITYNHDDAKMNQITVQETGAGSLTPSLYYQVLHNRYRKTANAENKMSFRTTAGISAYQQIDDAEKLDSSFVKRAEIEALNMADRQVDLAWMAEGRKIEAGLENFSAISTGSLLQEVRTSMSRFGVSITTSSRQLSLQSSSPICRTPSGRRSI